MEKEMNEEEYLDERMTLRYIKAVKPSYEVEYDVYECEYECGSEYN
jgi:hypothetical protein